MLDLVATALAAFACTEFVKTVVPWPLQPPMKLGLTAVVVGVIIALLEMAVLVGLGAWGLSALLHRLHRLLGGLGDVQRTTVISRAGARVR